MLVCLTKLARGRCMQFMFNPIQNSLNLIKTAIMGITLTLTAFIFGVIFGAIGYFEKIKPNGKLSTGTIIIITFFFLVMITGITNIIFQDGNSKDDKKVIIDRIDSATETLTRKIDTAMKNMNKSKY